MGTNLKPLDSISYLEASRIVANHNLSEKIDYLLASSCQLEKLEVFIKAHSIKNGFLSNYKLLAFNTLNQYLMSADNATNHVFLLFPWDLCPALDWRLGVSNDNLAIEDYIKQASQFLSRFSQIGNKKIIYFDFDIPPSLLSLSSKQLLKSKLIELVVANNILLGDSKKFSLSSYLSFGCPFPSNSLSVAANQIVQQLQSKPLNKKVLITDFDNVMWRGVIGEDGLDGIQHQAYGTGYIHYIYQTYLKKLKNAGILIAGVTRNDEQLAHAPFKSGAMPFKKDDFVAIMASYNAKSSQIIALSEQLNLPLDSFVFVDDNPLELEEVSNRCPQVECITFPKKEEEFILFLENVAGYFDIKQITQEDINRTQMYKARAAAVTPSTESGADLTDFLASLNMQIRVKYCTQENSTRPIQLINKTNQFNANGIRIKPEDAENILDEDRQLISFGLSDKYGDHGEIAVLLFDENKCLKNFVMSCRVFQRRVEFFILLWIYQNMSIKELNILFNETEKNLPFREFLSEVGASKDQGTEVVINLQQFFNKHTKIIELFSVISD